MKKFLYFFIFVFTMTVVGCAGGGNYYRTKMPIPPPRVISESAMSADSIPVEANVEESSSTSPAVASAPAPTQAASGTMSVYASPELLAEWRAEQAAKKSQPKTETKAVQAPKSNAPQAKARTSGNISQGRIQKIENRLGLLEDRFDASVAGETKGGMLYFRPGSVALSDDGKKYLDELATKFTAGNVKNIVIFGYASTSGKKDANLTLSQKRANTVRDYLSAKNVSAEVVAKGETDRFGQNTNVVITYDEK